MSIEELSGEERSRYARHLMLPEVGQAGQERLKASSVLCVGAGGLGSPLPVSYTHLTLPTICSV